MKRCIKLILTGLFLLAGLFCAIYNTDYSNGAGPYKDFESFKKARMKSAEKCEPISLIAVGDIMLSRYVAQKINELNDPDFPFQNISWFLKGGDITFGNLENPITPGRNIKITEMILRADPIMASALQNAGFNILSLANNHLPDFGTKGVTDTLQYLKDAHIKHIGAGKSREEAYEPQYININGLRLAFLAFTDPHIAPDGYSADDGPKTAALNSDNMKISITNAAKEADFVIIYLHLGTEYSQEPDENQIYYSHLAIDAGADLVIGSHPHVVQKVELYKGKYMLHSLGNFIFDQLWSEETRESIAVRISIGVNGVECMEFLPLYINDAVQPIVLAGESAVKVVDKLGLPLISENIPVWDSNNETFVSKERYVLNNIKTPRNFRLTQSRQYDLDGDGNPEDINLKDGHLFIKGGRETLWESPTNWWVDSFFVGDATNNGQPELCLSVWKEGSFGPYKPFWVEEEDTNVKNHLFIYRLENSELKPIWQSSNLDYPIIKAALMDLDGDGDNELVIREGSYTDPKRQELGLWKWDEWGFKRIKY